MLQNIGQNEHLQIWSNWHIKYEDEPEQKKYPMNVLKYTGCKIFTY